MSSPPPSPPREPREPPREPRQRSLRLDAPLNSLTLHAPGPPDAVLSAQPPPLAPPVNLPHHGALHPHAPGHAPGHDYDTLASPRKVRRPVRAMTRAAEAEEGPR